MTRTTDLSVPTLPHSWELDNWDKEAAGVFLAERVRFELTSPVKDCRFSRPVHSTALPPLLCDRTAD